jgi:type II secretory pathway predicted ATPase ExeA
MPFGKDIPEGSLSHHKAHDEAVARIGWAVGQRQIAVLAGEVGAGKTVALRSALAGLEPARHLVVYIANPTITMRGIHLAVAQALGAHPEFASGPLAHQTARLLAQELDERGRLPVLIIDEAHLLADHELESLRMLTNSDMDATSTFSLILAGQPTLRRRLKMAALSALDQRVATRYTMSGMTPTETTKYVQTHLAWAGRTDRLFSDDALAVIHNSSRGYPRAVNNLAVASMIAAYASSKAIIDQSSAEAAVIENTE